MHGEQSGASNQYLIVIYIGHHHDDCREPINFMFHYLDQDDDHILGPEELEELKTIPYENCIDQFLKGCDKTNDNQLSLPEFCQCFPIGKICTIDNKLMIIALTRTHGAVDRKNKYIERVQRDTNQ